MCGISGFLNKTNYHFEDEKIIKAFNELQHHRGPDYNGYSKSLNWHFFHQRLSLIDASTNGNQPFENENYILCFNGEIYNFLELKNDLPQVNFVSNSDTEVLFWYLIHHGIPKTLNSIRGMFAFSFFDKRKNELFVARDRFGIKPLYFTNQSNYFAFASESRTLAKVFGFKPDSYKMMMALNSTAESSHTFSMFNEIHTFKPGTYLKVDGSGFIEEFSYYQIADVIDVSYHNELKKLSTKAVVDKFDALLTKSTSEMMVSDFQMGAFVSGGIDSSIVSAIAKEKDPNFKLFTTDVLGKHSEYQDAKLLADHLNLDLKKTDFDTALFLSNWISCTEHNAAPLIYFTNAIPISQVAKLARENKVKAVLCGEGSDELFLGYSKLLAEKFKKPLLFPLHLIKKIYSIYPELKNYLLPSEKKDLNKFTVRLARGLKSEQLIEEGKQIYHFINKKELPFYLNSYEMSQNHLQGLLYRNDRMGMMHAIEVRFPFLHEDIVQFAMNLPLEYKNRWTSRFHNKKHPFLTDKWIVREIAKKKLPESLVNKKKNGLPIDGLNGFKIHSNFFKDGCIAELLQLDKKSLEYMLNNESSYFVGKLASIEVFAQIYDRQLSNNEIQNKINSNCIINK